MPALDTILEHVDISGEVPLGLVDIPTELIVGTKTCGRASSFAPNFMPILGENTETAQENGETTVAFKRSEYPGR